MGERKFFNKIQGMVPLYMLLCLVKENRDMKEEGVAKRKKV